MGGGPLRGLSRELVVVRRRGHGGPQTGEVDGEATKYLPRRALDVEQAQEEVFNSDLFVGAAERESRRPLQRSSGPVGELQVGGIADCHRDGDCFCHLVSAGVEGRTRGHQRPSGRAPTVGNDAEEKMLGPDVRMAEAPSLPLAKSDDPVGTVAESLEHGKNRTQMAIEAGGEK